MVAVSISLTSATRRAYTTRKLGPRVSDLVADSVAMGWGSGMHIPQFSRAGDAGVGSTLEKRCHQGV